MRKIIVSAQKIEKSSLITYSMIIAVFEVFDKLSYFCFLQKTFLLAKIKIKVVFGILFLIFNIANI